MLKFISSYSFRDYNWFWIFLVGPHVGAILGVCIFHLLLKGGYQEEPVSQTITSQSSSQNFDIMESLDLPNCQESNDTKLFTTWPRHSTSKASSAFPNTSLTTDDIFRQIQLLQYHSITLQNLQGLNPSHIPLTMQCNLYSIHFYLIKTSKSMYICIYSRS